MTKKSAKSSVPAKKAGATGQSVNATHCSHAGRKLTAAAERRGHDQNAFANPASAVVAEIPDPANAGASGQILGANQGPPARRKSKDVTAPLPIAVIIKRLSLLQRQRMFSIVQQSRSDRAVESYIARLLGYEVALDEDERKEQSPERKALFAKAQKIRLAIETGKALAADVAEVITEGTVSLVANAAFARKTWDSFRADSEKAMCELVVHLPVYEFAKTVKGFGDLGLAVIIAEAGNNLVRNATGFPTVAKLWKRLGLAVIGGERQQRKTDKELALLHGYSPKRRAQSWVFAESMMRHQLTSEGAAYRQDIAAHPKAMEYVKERAIVLAKLEVEELRELGAQFDIVSIARPSGPYGAIYAKRRQATADRGWSPAHQNADAKRVMFKALVRDLWRVWNGLPARYSAPPDMAEAAD